MARVLVIEDNPINLELMSYLLEAWQHEVLSADDGAQGLAVALAERPDLVLCDLQMPELDGYGVAKALRSHPALRQMPLIAVTALAREIDRERALAAGFDGVFCKPIDPAAFMAALQRYLPGAPVVAPASVPSARSAPGFPAIPEALRAPRQPCLLLTVDDGPTNVAYKRELLEPAGYSVLATDTVGKALALLQAHPVDLVLSDVLMPDGGGFELLRRLRQSPRWRALPLVFLTSSARDIESRERGLAMGAQAFLVRPIDAFELLRAIRSALEPAAAR
jgi:two-component system, cell cycle response regulator